MGDSDKRAAVITSWSSGIGLAVAKWLAAKEARVVITGRRQQAIGDTVGGVGTRDGDIRRALEDSPTLTPDAMTGS